MIVTITKESQPNWYAALKVFRNCFGDLLPLMRFSRRFCVDEMTKKPMIWFGFMPALKNEEPLSAFRPNIRVDSEKIEFYEGFNWKPISEQELIEKTKAMKDSFKFVEGESATKYIPEKDAFAVFAKTAE